MMTLKMIYKIGIFIRELENRFKAEVLIDGIVTICYVSSSCKLNKLIDLSQQEIILKEIKNSKTGLQYSIIAVKKGKKFIILNSNYANLAYENYLCKKSNVTNIDDIRVFREITISGYKSDFYFQDTKTIVEIKSIISKEREVIFPQVKSERFIRQIQTIETLIKNGYNYKLIIIGLNPDLKKIIFDKQLNILKEYNNNSGFTIEGYICNLNKDMIPIIIGSLKTCFLN